MSHTSPNPHLHLFYLDKSRKFQPDLKVLGTFARIPFRMWVLTTHERVFVTCVAVEPVGVLVVLVVEGGGGGETEGLFRGLLLLGFIV